MNNKVTCYLCFHLARWLSVLLFLFCLVLSLCVRAITKRCLTKWWYLCPILMICRCSGDSQPEEWSQLGLQASFNNKITLLKNKLIVWLESAQLARKTCRRKFVKPKNLCRGTTHSSFNPSYAEIRVLMIPPTFFHPGPEVNSPQHKNHPSLVKPNDQTLNNVPGNYPKLGTTKTDHIPVS